MLHMYIIEAKAVVACRDALWLPYRKDKAQLKEAIEAAGPVKAIFAHADVVRCHNTAACSLHTPPACISVCLAQNFWHKTFLCSSRQACFSHTGCICFAQGRARHYLSQPPLQYWNITAATISLSGPSGPLEVVSWKRSLSSASFSQGSGLSCPVLSLFYLPLQTLIELLALIRVNNRQVSINPVSAKSPSHRHLSHSRRKGSQALLLGLASSGTCRQEVAKGLKSWHHCLQGTFPARKGLWGLVKASLNCALQMDSRRGASHGIT